MATLHVMHGLPGSGKSTFASKLAAKTQGIILANDSWINTLYPDHCARELYVEQVRRVERIQTDLALQVLQRGIDIIWDYGVWSIDDRKTILRTFNAPAVRIHFYSLQCPPSIADQRVLNRNSRANPSHAINQPALDYFRTLFHPITSTEGIEYTLIDTTNEPNNAL